jgi:cbb3-type cytochrome oxidase maturation protein
MIDFFFPVPIAIGLGLAGLASFMWTLKTGQYDDLESAAQPSTLKRRKQGIVRQVPLPRSLLAELNHVFHLWRRQRDPDSAYRRIWTWSRTTASGVSESFLAQILAHRFPTKNSDVISINYLHGITLKSTLRARWKR